jgi:diguanylate cyclase (GGDEF)-like protein/PAS domain S-box-containing protein
MRQRAIGLSRPVWEHGAMSDGNIRAIFEGALDPMLLADDDARYIDANPAACAFFGLSREALCNLGVADFTPLEARAAFSEVWRSFLTEGRQRGEYALQMPDGRLCEIEFSATANVRPGEHLSIIRDVTERKRLDGEQTRLTAEANVLARTDDLTGLPNRRVWNERIVDELQRAQRSDQPLTVAVIDLDGFKTVNDTRGHAAGDRQLETVATVWRTQLRDIDLLARVGGDEFRVLFPACPQGQEDAVLQRMRAVMPPGQTFSAGTATWDRAESAAQLHERADQALYQDKLNRSTHVASLKGSPSAP